MTIFDAHTHAFAPAQIARRALIAEGDATFAEMYGDPSANMADAPGVVLALDDAGVDRAVIAGFAFGSQGDIEEQSAHILAAAGEAPARIVPLVSVNPDLAGWERCARGALDRGARGFGELRPHNQDWDPLGPAGRALCGLAADSGTVLLWHVSEPVGHSYAGKMGGISPAELCELAALFPRARMIAAHFGGGLPFYLQMPEVRASLRNVWFDTAATSLLYDEQSVARLVDLAGLGRVLFGSDYPLLSPRRQLQRLQALLPGDVALAVIGKNAETLFSDNTTHE